MADRVLVAKNISKYFNKGKTIAIDSISLSLKKGTITGLVGPDGSGKTTFIRICAGILEPSQGEIQVLGLSPFSDKGLLQNDIGYMPQRFGLYEDLTIKENLDLHASLRELTGEKKGEKFNQLLSFTNLAQFSNRLAGNLSGGMKQKLGLACSLLGDPKILLLDEPGVGVDPISRRELWRIVKTLCSEGMTVLWNTAYMDEAEICDDIYLLNEGAVLAHGRFASLKNKVKNRTFVITPSALDHRRALKKILTHQGILDGLISGNNIRVLVSDKYTHNPAPLFNELKVLLGENVLSINPCPAKLEDVFMDFLGGIQTRVSPLSGLLVDFKSELAIENQPIVKTSNLTKNFGDFRAVDHVSLSIKPGTVYGLLGPNGAGKSTTFKMLCGLLPPSEGLSLIANRSFKKEGFTLRQKIGYMAQKFSLYTSLTVYQNLNFFSGIYGLSGKKQKMMIDQMIDMFNLSHYLHSQCSLLPLGIKQRLALSCSLMHKPELLFLDEPTSGVDPIVRREFWTHIDGLVLQGVTIIVTTHFMEEAEFCDTIGLVYRGKLIAEGTPNHIKNIAATATNPHPTMETAFIKIIEMNDV